MKKGIIFISMLFASGCYYDIAEELYPGNANEPCDATPDMYHSKIANIIATNCALSGCHVAGGESPDLSDSSVVYDKVDRIQERALNLKDMPKSGPLSSCDIKALQNWISGGTK